MRLPIGRAKSHKTLRKLAMAPPMDRLRVIASNRLSCQTPTSVTTWARRAGAMVLA
jgi:hypothetical protein